MRYCPCSFSCLSVISPFLCFYPPFAASVAHQEDIPRLSQNCTEPFAITIRPLQKHKNVKLIFWYVGSLDDPEGAPRVGTHMVAEGFEESVLFEVDEALEKLSFEDDKDLLRLAAKYAEQYKRDHMVAR